MEITLDLMEITDFTADLTIGRKIKFNCLVQPNLI